MMISQADADAEFLVYLGQKIVGVRAMLESRPSYAEVWRDRERQIEVMIEEVAQGLHRDFEQIEGIRARYNDGTPA